MKQVKIVFKPFDLKPKGEVAKSISKFYRHRRITSAVKGIHIDPNPDKDGRKTVAVTFHNGDAQVVKCGVNDEFDPKIGVALAIAYESFGSRSQFRKFMDGIANVVPERKSKVKAVPKKGGKK